MSFTAPVRYAGFALVTPATHFCFISQAPLQELARLEKLADAPEFLPLLEDYAKDLADPKASPTRPVLRVTMPCMHLKMGPCVFALVKHA